MHASSSHTKSADLLFVPTQWKRRPQGCRAPLYRRGTNRARTEKQDGLKNALLFKSWQQKISRRVLHPGRQVLVVFCAPPPMFWSVLFWIHSSKNWNLTILFERLGKKREWLSLWQLAAYYCIKNATRRKHFVWRTICAVLVCITVH